MKNKPSRLLALPLALALLLPSPVKARNIAKECHIPNREGLIEVGYTAEQIDDFVRGCQDFIDGMVEATYQSDAYYVGYEYAANRYGQ